MKQAIFSLIALSSILVTGSSPAADDKGSVLISDTFALGSNGREAGAVLNKQAPETGDGTWNGAPGTVFGPEGGITTAEANDGVGGTIPLPQSARKIVIEADVVPQDSGWVTIALQSAPSALEYWKNVQIFFAVRPSGQYEAYADKVQYQIAKGKVPPADVYHLSLEYNADANTVSLRINGDTVVSDDNLSGFTPAANYAGFRIHMPTAPNAPLVRNFTVRSVQ